MPAGVQSIEHVASYQISLDGSPIAQEHADRVREIRVVSSLASPDVCTMQVLFDQPSDAGDPHPLDKLPFALGKLLDIKLGKADDRAPKKLFTGEIVTVEPEFGAGGGQLTIRAFDKAHRLARSRRLRTFQNQTVSDIVKKVCGEVGLPIKTDASGGPLPYMQQVNETDWDFITRLAERHGFEFVIIDGKAEFRRPKGPPTPIELSYPAELFSFHPRVTAVQQVDSVEVRAFSHKDKAALTGTSAPPDVLARIGLSRDKAREKFTGDKLRVATEPAPDAGIAKNLANALQNRMANGYCTAEGSTFGNPDIRAGAAINVKGVGKTYGGVYRVHTAIHTLRGGGTYETRFTNAPGYTIASMLGGGGGGGATSGAAATSFAGQIVVGIVTNNSDPDKVGRVKVKFPTLDDSAESHWAVVVVPSAGKERGLMMLPVVGEEVLVCFEHGDITRPVVLGSLFNGKEKPGDVLAAQDGSFGLRSDEKIVTNSKKATELTSEDTFTLKASKAMKLTTDQTLDLKAGQAATFKSDQSLELSGAQQVKISTNGSQLTIEAPTGSLSINAMNLKLSASGTVQISGAQIMLG